VPSVLKQPAACLVALSLLLGVPSAALADVTACVQAHTSGQREAKAGRFKAASELFASCVSEQGCPDAIRAECAEFYKGAEHSVPTLIFAALDERGGDLIQVRVSAEEQVLCETLDGRPIPVDPGEHHFKFELASGQVLESDVLVREGEKNRIVSVRAKPTPSTASEARTSSLDVDQGARKLPTSFWVASGVGAAALVSFGAFAAMGHGKQSSLNDCSPSCSSSSHADYDAMSQNYLIADISLGVAVVSAGVATWLFLSSDRSRAAAHASAGPVARLSLTPLVSTRGAGLVFNATAF